MSQLSKEEIEQLRPQEGMTAAEFDKLRQNNQPSALQQVRNGDILPVEKQQESTPAPETKDASKAETKEAPKPEAKKTTAKRATAKKTTAKKTTPRKTAARSTKK